MDPLDVKKFALSQAVVWANSHAHAVRHPAEGVVLAAEQFEAFLRKTPDIEKDPGE